MADTLEQEGFRLYRRTDRYIVSPARVARPAGTEVTQVPFCGFYPLTALLPAYNSRGRLVGGLPFVDELDEELITLTGPVEVRDAYYAGGTLPSSGTTGFICGAYSKRVDTPAVSASEAVYLQPPAAGWNAAAVSAQAFYNYGRARFRVQAGGKFMVGLSNNLDPTELGVNRKFIGWYIDDDLASPRLRGYGDEGSLTSGALGDGTYVPFDDTVVYTVELLNGRMYFRRADRSNTSYSYPLPLGFDTPDVWMLSAVIWEPGTWVEGIEVVQSNMTDSSNESTNGELPAMRGGGGQGTPRAQSEGALPRMTGSGRNATRGGTSTPRMLTNASDYVLGWSESTLPSMRVASQEELIAVGPPRANVRTKPMLGSGYSLVGEVGRSAVVLPVTIGRASEGNRGEAATVLPSPRTIAWALAEGEVQMHSFYSGVSAMTAPTEYLVVMDSAGTITTVIGVVLVLDGGVTSTATLADSYTLSATLEALMNSRALIGADAPADGEPSEVWAVSMAEMPASSTFENFAFTSFGVVAGQAYGVREDGLFMLDGDTDDGAPIRASVSFGKQDFNSKTLKHMSRAYIGASAAGKMYLKIIAEGNEYIYAARDASSELQQQRFDVGRGIKGNYFTFELFNKNGADFELDSVTFVAADFKRRI